MVTKLVRLGAEIDGIDATFTTGDLCTFLGFEFRYPTHTLTHTHTNILDAIAEVRLIFGNRRIVKRPALVSQSLINVD